MSDITDLADCRVSINPAAMGAAFARMDSAEQADFFWGIAKVVGSWDKHPSFQWSMMRRDLDQRPDALQVFQQMAEHAEDN